MPARINKVLFRLQLNYFLKTYALENYVKKPYALWVIATGPFCYEWHGFSAFQSLYE